MKERMKNRILVVLLAVAALACVALAACSGSSEERENKADNEYEEYNITLNFHDGVSVNDHIYVNKADGVVKAKGNPVRTGYEFDGWYTAPEGGEKIDLASCAVAEDMTLYAHWNIGSYTVLYENNYGDAGTFETAEVLYGDAAEAPASDPVREGYVFLYWAATEAGGSAYDFATPIKKDTTLYAAWREDTIPVYSVTLHYNNGTDKSAEYEIEEGKSISKSNANKAQYKGYTLIGYSEKQNASPSDSDIIPIGSFPFKPTANMTLYAVWEKAQYLASFRYNYYDNPENAGNSAAVYENKNFYYGDTVEAPEDPVRDGYTFDGWFNAAGSNGEMISFPYAPDAGNFVYYAHWKSEELYTDKLQIEYVDFDPTMMYPGYSGGVTGSTCILISDVSGVDVDEYPLNSQRAGHNGGKETAIMFPINMWNFT